MNYRRSLNLLWPLACGHIASHTLCSGWLRCAGFEYFCLSSPIIWVEKRPHWWRWLGVNGTQSLQSCAEKRKKTGKQREYRLCVVHRWMRPQFGCHRSNPEFCDWPYTYKQNKNNFLRDASLRSHIYYFYDKFW